MLAEPSPTPEQRGGKEAPAALIYVRSRALHDNLRRNYVFAAHKHGRGRYYLRAVVQIRAEQTLEFGARDATCLSWDELGQTTVDAAPAASPVVHTASQRRFRITTNTSIGSWSCDYYQTVAKTSSVETTQVRPHMQIQDSRHRGFSRVGGAIWPIWQFGGASEALFVGLDTDTT
eukprot:1188718-Prorocentrum_minimum.AAC.6